MVKTPVYFDYAATAPVDPRVVEAMLGLLGPDGDFGNPSAVHAYGRKAAALVEEAREEIAALLGVAASGIVFTSGATESDNLAIKGAARAAARRGRHVITEKTAHKAVLDACRALEREGFEVSYLVPDREGRISAAQLEASLRPDTILVSLLHANNETGVLQDIPALAAAVRRHGALFHLDAAQSAGKVELPLEQVDLLALSAHKFCGPKGAGLLYVRPGVRLEPLLHGGGHERGRRAGTLATHQIRGMALAFRLAVESMVEESSRLAGFSSRLIEGLCALSGVLLNGHREARLPNIVNVSVEGVDGEALQLALRDIACSSGAACNSASGEPSYVLRALGRDDALAGASLRFSMGRWTRVEEVDYLLERFGSELTRLRRIAGAA